MPLADRNWSTSYPGIQDTVGVEQPDLIADSYDGARDGHRILITHVHTLRNKLQQLALLVGDSGDLPAVTSLRARVTTLEGAGSTDEKAGVTVADTTPNYLDSKISVANGLLKSTLNPAGNEQLQLEPDYGAVANKVCEGDDARLSDNRTDATAIHDNIASEISVVTLKGAPVSGDFILIEDSAAANVKKRITVGTLPAGGAGSDTDAIHDNVASEISAVAAKGAPVSGDYILIEDSADSNNKKSITIGNLPTGSDSAAIHDNVASEISAVASKGAPIGADFLLIEDSADSNNKKSIIISNLPTGSDAAAIHDNVAAEINAIAVKGTPVSADVIVLEDSADSWNKKKAALSTLPGGGGSSTFVGLTDTPANFTGSAGKYSKVNSGETALEFIDGIPVPGSRIIMMEEIPTGDRTTTSATFVDITDLDGTFDVAYDGLYDITFDTHGVYVTGSFAVAEWQLVFDAAGTPQTVGSGNNTWITTLGAASDREAGTFHTQVQLTAGSHTVKVQWKRIQGTGTLTFSTIYSSANIYGTLITGSGVGGILPLSEQLLTTQRNISATTPSPIPTEPMTITFDADAGEIVTLGYFCLCLWGVGTTCHAQMRLDGTLLGAANSTIVGAATTEESMTEVFPYEMLSSGTHTLDLYCWSYTSQNFNLQVNSRLWAEQFRGGLVPYYTAADVLVQDKPTSIKAGDGISLTNNSGQVTIASERFIDALDDNSLDVTWTTDIPTVGTVDEQNNRLEIAHTGGTNLDWYGGVNFNAPGVYVAVKPQDFTAKVFVDNITATNEQNAAMILYLTGTTSSFHRLELFYDGAYKVRSINDAAVGSATTVSQDNLWLCVMRRGNRIFFMYSTAIISAEPELNDMTILASHTTGIDLGFTILNNILSLRSITSVGNPAFTNYYNNFSLIYP